MEIKMLKLEELKPYENNPRFNDNAVEYVAKSIKEFGFKVPIIIDKNNEIVAGHTRYKASLKLGLNEVPCIIADDLNEEQIKAFRLADNKVSEQATWNYDLLDIELDDIDLSDFDFDMKDFGFDYNNSEEIEEEIEIEEDEIPEIPEEPKSKLGDIYQLGEHRLMCGSALNKEEVERLLNGNKCELTFTDPPYQLETQGGGILKNANSMKQIKENGVDEFNPQELIMFSDTNIYCHNKPLIKKYIELAESNNKP